MAVAGAEITLTGLNCDTSRSLNLISVKQIKKIKGLADSELVKTQDDPESLTNPLNTILALNSTEQKDQSKLIEINEKTYKVSLKCYVGYHFMLLSHVKFFQKRDGKNFNSLKVDEWCSTLNNSLVPRVVMCSFGLRNSTANRITRAEYPSSIGKTSGVQYTYTLTEEPGGAGYDNTIIVSYFNQNSTDPVTVSPVLPRHGFFRGGWF